jgi:hypothetical protein
MQITAVRVKDSEDAGLAYKTGTSPKHQAMLLDEAANMLMLDHQNVMGISGVVQLPNGSVRGLLMPIADLGNLKQVRPPSHDKDASLLGHTP